MKKVLLFVALALFVYSAVARHVITDELIDSINNDPSSTWTAGHNKFSSWSAEDIKRLLGTHIPETPKLDEKKRMSISWGKASEVPTSFDARDKWGKCIHPIRNQEQCGSCWAFSASEVLSDRFCIVSNSSVNVVLSPQWLVSCDYTDYGCNGGMLDNVWKYMKDHGIVTDSCDPYVSGDGHEPPCPTKCSDGSALKMYKASSYKHIGSWIIFWKRVEEIQTAIMDNGPVQAAFSVYEDFMSYKSGVYVHKSGQLLGGHAIKIIGWGVENGVDYWLVANSWGTDWGLDGFFKIKRGDDQCGIESQVYAGEPAL